jgi:hypothetical protein
MRQLLSITLAGFVGAAIGGAGGLALLAAYRAMSPPGPMPMGDMEAPVVAVIGLLAGGGIGCFAANVALGWTNRRADREAIRPFAEASSKLLYLVRMSALVLFVIAGVVTAYFAAWDQTGNWQRWVQLTSFVIVPLPLALPYLVVFGLAWLARRHNSLLLLWLAALALMSTAFMIYHLPGSYQTISGGEPTGDPNGTYHFALVIVGVLEWGILLIAALAQGGYLAARRLGA